MYARQPCARPVAPPESGSHRPLSRPGSGWSPALRPPTSVGLAGLAGFARASPPPGLAPRQPGRPPRPASPHRSFGFGKTRATPARRRGASPRRPVETTRPADVRPLASTRPTVQSREDGGPERTGERPDVRSLLRSGHRPAANKFTCPLVGAGQRETDNSAVPAGHEDVPTPAVTAPTPGRTPGGPRAEPGIATPRGVRRARRVGKRPVGPTVLPRAR
ncbi:MAG: hypothetical protein AVDCRST_MAG49-299 [uncultured Thermomicrobiales bacterium]|uniref:Uncharacterized protein n=1 Tax=uncultured Thermomicrobiales bacterium TaxID=1645740 RepID=A0A6J4U026_9BACT|nr:MAG: hypothetical protein AVDCRST_MAG49-299 [uncultured Thermomicrobiales bacterium]